MTTEAPTKPSSIIRHIDNMDSNFECGAKSFWGDICGKDFGHKEKEHKCKNCGQEWSDV